jgi:hypothetical protein
VTHAAVSHVVTGKRRTEARQDSNHCLEEKVRVEQQRPGEPATGANMHSGADTERPSGANPVEAKRLRSH